MRIHTHTAMLSLVAMAAWIGSAFAQTPIVGPPAYDAANAPGLNAPTNANPYGVIQAQYAAPQSPYNPAVQNMAQAPGSPGQGAYPEAYPAAGEGGANSASASLYGSSNAPAGATTGQSCLLNDPDALYGPRWAFRADELFLQRSTTRSQSLFLADDLTTDLLNSQTGLNFPVATGLQFSASRQIVDNWSFEVGYFQLDGWEANNYVPGPGYMVIGNQEPYYYVTDAHARYTSALYLGELNLRVRCNDWFTLITGFRMGELDERYKAAGADFWNTDPAVTDTLTATAINHLYGFQLGADTEVLRMGAMRLNSVCKGGIYRNAITQTTARFDDLGVSDQLMTANAVQTAFMGELGLVLSYQISGNWTVRAMYQAVWMTGVALAPEQIGATNFGSSIVGVDGHGQLFYHGGGIGLELKF